MYKFELIQFIRDEGTPNSVYTGQVNEGKIERMGGGLIRMRYTAVDNSDPEITSPTLDGQVCWARSNSRVLIAETQSSLLDEPYTHLQQTIRDAMRAETFVSQGGYHISGRGNLDWSERMLLISDAEKAGQLIGLGLLAETGMVLQPNMLLEIINRLSVTVD